MLSGMTAILPSSHLMRGQGGIDTAGADAGRLIWEISIPRLRLEHTKTAKEGNTMIEQDTIRLLRECDAGVKMGVEAIEQVLPHAKSAALREYLSESKNDHKTLDRRLQKLLDRYHDDGKEPNPMAKGMSWIKTNAKLALEDGDATVADLITDGCNMGVKSLRKYLNQYQAADEDSKNAAKELIELEERLTAQMRSYL